MSSRTIARWLKCFMAEVGIDISIFKAHSIRGALHSTAAGVEVTTKDILDVTDWSSEGTFQRFYCRELRKMTGFLLVLQSCHQGHLQTMHVDM